MNKNRFYDPFKMLDAVVLDENKKVCPNCKSRNEKKAQFCVYCGFKFNTNIINNIIIDKNEDTVLLRKSNNSESETKAFLLHNGIKTEIDKNEFSIGKDKSNVDFYVNSKVVSRIHAKIVMQDGIYYLIDNGSTNGTFINGSRVRPTLKSKISTNDKIRIANEEFVFILS